MWQRIAFAICAAVFAAGSLSWFETAQSVLATALMATFACVIAVRSLALWAILFPDGRAVPDYGRIPDDLLPTYTVLVPVYQETVVARQLTRAMAMLDYPEAKLQILFICEADDLPTQAALRHAGLAENMRVIIVPDGRPRTKPRALNFGLSHATGDYVVVYDAEDEPETDQLRSAVGAFREGGPRLGCLQAQLKIYNADDSWLTRQFAIEYAALFGFILPAFERFGLPITLGGTSNHFPRHVLIGVGAWDPFNVTEDADLGLRLARLGWQVGLLRSATWEEAPDTYRDWHNQRVRWLKGWMATAIVHTRQPLRLWRELGAIRFFAVLVMLASMLLSACVHPIYLAVLIGSILGGAGVGDWWWPGLLVFVAGYAASLAVALVAACRGDHNGLARRVPWMPIYWLLISGAAAGALYEYWFKQFRWNKTPHFGRGKARLTRGSGGLGSSGEEVADQL